MTNISRHPLLQHAYDVCQEIEKCGASPQLTAAVSKASELLSELDKFIPESTGMSFGLALDALKLGERVTRKGWNGKGMWLQLRDADGVYLPLVLLVYPVGSAAYENGAYVPWAPSQTDMLADDWQLFS